MFPEKFISNPDIIVALRFNNFALYSKNGSLPCLKICFLYFLILWSFSLQTEVLRDSKFQKFNISKLQNLFRLQNGPAFDLFWDYRFKLKTNSNLSDSSLCRSPSFERRSDNSAYDDLNLFILRENVFLERNKTWKIEWLSSIGRFRQCSSTKM